MPASRKVGPSPLGILAGGGAMPLIVAQAARASGRPVHIVAIEGHADPLIEQFPHNWANMGRVGAMLKALRNAQCRDLVIIGHVIRPNIEKLRLDLGAVLSLPTVFSLTIGGDDKLLGNVVRFFEGEGFRVVPAQDIAPGLLSSKGRIGRRKPGKSDLADIKIGASVIAALGPMDVGQSVTVVREHVLAVEAVEGTDAMLERAAKLRQWGMLSAFRRSGVLVKSSKPGQERRIDVATIGPETISRAVKAKLAGIAIAAGDVMIASREETIAAADKAGLFLYGFEMPRKKRPG